MRFFLAHSKAEEGDVLDAIVVRTRRIIGDENELVLGRDDFAENIGSSGGWDGWTYSIANRVDPDSGQRVYDGIIVPSHRVGKATAAIVQAALEARVPVFAFDDPPTDPELLESWTDDPTEVGVIEMTTPRDYKTGWTLSPF